MQFTSPSFWLWFVGIFAVYTRLPHRAQNLLLLAFSYIFYGAWDWRFLSLIFISTAVDFYVGRRLHEERDDKKRKRWLLISLGANLGLLGVFKYANFFAGSLQHLLHNFGVQADSLTLSIVLPVGISFYTFQTLSYTIDIYRRKMEPSESLVDFALFVAFFPQLVAGPIERAKNLLQNIEKPRVLLWGNFSRGVYLCLFGLVKKVVVGDGMAASVGSVYENAGQVSGGDVWLATFYFALQIYCDFSGYTDIARGLSKMLGFELMHNFRQPYFSTNPQAFWRRWHISLSTWLRDYLYISLGGNRGGPTMVYRNLMLTMVLGGLWHGAAWNFVFWGIYQGALLCGHRLIVGKESEGRLWLYPLKLAGFFALTCYGWMLFRASSFDQIVQYTVLMVDLPAIARGVSEAVLRPPLGAVVGAIYIIAHDVMEYRSNSTTFYLQLSTPLRGLNIAIMITLFLMGLQNESTQFLYFQF